MPEENTQPDNQQPTTHPNLVVDERHDETAAGSRPPQDSVGLCLSGGGYRAMVFHVGVLWRLHEAGWLQRLTRISSVSGGSITAAVLGLAWERVMQDSLGSTDNFRAGLVEPVRRMAGKSIDVRSVGVGVLLPGSVSDSINSAYDKHLFQGATLQDLPDRPRFVINATNLSSGVLWRFCKPYMWDYRVGKVPDPRVALSTAVAASSAFPPFLSPCVLELDPNSFQANSGDDLQREPYTEAAYLTDGGVYDNLGLETVWKSHATVLVSDAGGQMAAEEEPESDWARQSKRVLDVIDNQVRSLRKRQLIGAYQSGERQGAYWGIRTDVADYQLEANGGEPPLSAPFPATTALAEIPTRLKRMPDAVQERLINWGYAVCDAALRRHVDASLPRGSWPYPGGVVSS